jgi:hypothetical protein
MFVRGCLLLRLPVNDGTTPFPLISALQPPDFVLLRKSRTDKLQLDAPLIIPITEILHSFCTR